MGIRTVLAGFAVAVAALASGAAHADMNDKCLVVPSLYVHDGPSTTSATVCIPWPIS